MILMDTLLEHCVWEVFWSKEAFAASLRFGDLGMDYRNLVVFGCTHFW